MENCFGSLFQCGVSLRKVVGLRVNLALPFSDTLNISFTKCVGFVETLSVPSYDNLGYFLIDIDPACQKFLSYSVGFSPTSPASSVRLCVTVHFFYFCET